MVRASGPAHQRLEGLARTVALVGGLVAILGTVLGAVVAWPDDWWPRRLPEPKLYMKDVEYGSSFGVPVAADALNHPPPDVRFACADRTSAWLRSLGGVPYWVSVEFVLTTERPESVVVLGLTPHVRRITSPPLRTDVQGCGVPTALIQERSAEFVVDSQPPKLEMTDERGRSVDRMGLNLGKGEAADFKLEAYAEQTGGV
ncbi:hypothetical protein [Streptomyces sp. HUAS TT3]|uniref:hypothetical protein n=1 Tax=Streptomyces sp. HUAS TT3 TaxID=3447510 RepID=UPI003F65D8A4